MRGAELALAADVDELTVTVSLSETYNQRNVQMSIAESTAVIEQICALAGPIPVDAVVSCAFGSPYEGDVPPAAVAVPGAAPARRRAARPSPVPTPRAWPRPAASARSSTAVGTDIGLHLHETRGTALVCAYTAMQLGVDRFDTSVGGLGGSPFADGAAGNLATEGLVAMLDDLGVHTGIDVDGLIDAAELAERAGGPTAAEPGRQRRAPHPSGRAEERRGTLSRALVRHVRPLLQPQLAARRRHLPHVRAGGAPPARPTCGSRRDARTRARRGTSRLLIAVTAVYLGYRLFQGIVWVAHHL